MFTNTFDRYQRTHHQPMVDNGKAGFTKLLLDLVN